VLSGVIVLLGLEATMKADTYRLQAEYAGNMLTLRSLAW
jgi:hypothetical protein